MDKVISKPNTDLMQMEYKVYKYRFINASSRSTNESINIGLIVYEKDNKKPKICINDYLTIYRKLFPIFDIKHVYDCVRSIETKYKLGKVNEVPVAISSSISLSSVRTHKHFFTDNRAIENILMDKYLTLSKSDKYVSKLIRLKRYGIDMMPGMFNLGKREEYIETEIIEESKALMDITTPRMNEIRQKQVMGSSL